MKFRNMKEIGEYIKQLQQEGQELAEEKKLSDTPSVDRDFVHKFDKLLVKEIGD